MIKFWFQDMVENLYIGYYINGDGDLGHNILLLSEDRTTGKTIGGRWFNE